MQTLRNHLPFILIVPLFIIVMTWPTFAHSLDFDSFWLPKSGGDIWGKIWDTNYGKLLFAGEEDFFHTDLLFYPNGVSLVFHNLSLPHMLVFGALQALLPLANAYNLTYLLILFANALSAYILLQDLFADKWIATAGAIAFTVSPFMLGHPAHPETITVATIPLALWAFHRVLQNQRLKWYVICGIFCGITAFIGMYVYVCLLLTMGIYTLSRLPKNGRDPRFWRGLILLLVIAAAISLLRISPMIGDTQRLDDALSLYAGKQSGTDPLVYFVNVWHPLTSPVLEALFNQPRQAVASDAYLGIVPLALVLYAIARSRHRRIMLPWLIAALLFAVLRLDSVLIIGGHNTGILLPKYYLDRIVPWLTKGFWTQRFLQIGLLLPLVILACFGLRAVLASVRPRWRTLATIIIILLLAFDYFRAPLPVMRLDPEQLQWIDWLRTEEDQDTIRLINLPINYHRAKLYGFYQSLNGYPHAEGRVARLPSDAYDYINGNYLLNSWRSGENTFCLASKRDDYLAALDQLIADGFSHLVAHRTLPEYEAIAHSFAGVPVSYEDDYVSIYRIADLRSSCESSALLVPNALAHLHTLDLPLPDFPSLNAGALTLHPSGDISAGMLPLYTSLFAEWSSLLHLNLADGKVTHPPPSIGQQTGAEDMLSANSTFVLVYDPTQTVETELDSYRSWLSRDFNYCTSLFESDDLVIDFFIRHELPCDLETDQNPFAIEFDNGIRLGTLVTLLHERRLDLHFLWSDLSDERYAFSIQLFDADGAKALGQDYVIADKPLAHQRINLSPLPSGDYVAKLIVYNYDTGTSVPGTVKSSGTRFDRAYEIGLITLD